MKSVYLWMQEVMIVEGYNRVALYDLPRNDYSFAPKEIKSFIQKIAGKSDEEISLNEEEQEWLDFFLRMEYVIKVPATSFDYFSPLKILWDVPSVISTAEIEDNSNLPIIIDFLERLICKNIVIRVRDIIRLKEILRDFTSDININKINFIITEKTKKNEIAALRKEYNHLLGDIFFLNSRKSKKGRYTPFFSNNIYVFSEAQKYNVFYNRRIYINAKGNIGITSDIISNINVRDLYDKEIKQISSILKKTFYKYWVYGKNKIEVCKDCELRYMCIDKVNFPVFQTI